MKLRIQLSSQPGKPFELKILRRTKKYIGLTIESTSGDESANNLPPSCCDRYCIGYRNPTNPCDVKIVFNTTNLRRSRDWGLEIVHGLLFPLFSVYGSEIVATIFFLTALISCILSSYTFAHEARRGRYPTLEVVQFSLSLTFLFLSTINFFYNIRSCLLGIKSTM